MPDFKLPDLGEGVTEGEIDRWLVKEGDRVGEDDLLVEVITDKATAEIPSPFAGVVEKIHVGQGEVVPVGTTLVTITSDGDALSPAAPPKARGTEAESDQAATRLDRDRTTSSRGRVRAMPPVRKLARDLRVDLSRVIGTGPHGRILRADVEAAARGDAPATVPAADRRERLRGIRRTIAERMATSHRVVPPVTHVEECDVTELDATRRAANERQPTIKLTFLPFIVKAVVSGLKRYPSLNASLDDDAQEIEFHADHHIGIAVDTDAGLTVPVIHDAGRKSLQQLAGEIEELADAARRGRLRTDQLRGGTFTITSPGPFGGLMATPIVFHPQAAILGVHRAVDRPVVRDAQVVVRKIMNLSVTFDHRVLDGMTAARFMLHVVRLLEHPALLALED